MNKETYAPKQGETPNAETVIQLTKDDLPLHCPLDRMRLWDSHPRVYLPLEADGTAMCPYCGTRFVLIETDEGD